MVTMKQIRQLSRQIGKEFRPRRIILFGSYARAAATEDSDVDLLIITPFKGRSVAKSVEIRLKVRPPFPVDLIVRTPEKVRERLAMGDSVMREILESGKVLYETRDA
jgi:predicted nucleotidyltransferase